MKPVSEAPRGDAESTSGRRGPARPGLLTTVGVVLFSFLFFKNAWIDEDAYITFRSIDQLLAGNGLRWNPHERVQAFTHPLWLFILTPLRGLGIGPFWAALLASFGSCLAMLATLRRTLDSDEKWALLLLMLVSSKSFFDFTSSGLENSLAYALLAFFLLLFSRSQHPLEVSHEGEAIPECGQDGSERSPRSGSDDATRTPFWLALIFALLLVTRHDLLTLVLPPFALVIWQQRHQPLARLTTFTMLGLLPFILWTGFSLFYYGFAFPNTAYAKLGTGIPASALWLQGLHYLESLARDDALAALVIVAAMGLCLLDRRPGARALGTGLIVNLLYVVSVGGDYMTGRFLSCGFLLAATFLASRPRVSARLLGVSLAGAAAYAIVLPGSPISSGASYRVESPNEYGVGDQRGLLFPISSIYQWFETARSGAPFPDYHWTHEGIAFADSTETIRTRANLGFMGYWAGSDKIIIDRLALADPLLARLPSIRLWRIGHFPRKIPAGYAEQVRTGLPRIEDPSLREFQRRLEIITQGELITAERFETIIRMNAGCYDPLLEPGD